MAKIKQKDEPVDLTPRPSFQAVPVVPNPEALERLEKAVDSAFEAKPATEEAWSNLEERKPDEQAGLNIVLGSDGVWHQEGKEPVPVDIPFLRYSDRQTVEFIESIVSEKMQQFIEEPLPVETANEGEPANQVDVYYHRTLRDGIATEIAAALVAKYAFNSPSPKDSELMVHIKTAVKFADLLILELEK